MHKSSKCDIIKGETDGVTLSSLECSEFEWLTHSKHSLNYMTSINYSTP